MSETMSPDREVGGGPGGPVDDHRDHPTATPNQPLTGEFNFGDSSGPLFDIYSKAAEEEDNKMVDRWQKDADGILFFTGLFSAAVAALLAVTVMDLRPSSQDTSAFYLGNIYQVLADPNVTRSSIPSPVAKPPSFSPPRYAVWVNTLWFLSLVMSLSCALWATSLQQWARRYLHRAQPARCSPEKRARMRAFFAEGVEKMHIPWAVEGLPMLLHLSLFLFFGGVAIFLFHVDREVFFFVICWIGLFSLVYGLITLLPIIRHNSPYHSPLSTPAWFLYAGIPHVTFKILTFIITLGRGWSSQAYRYCVELEDHYQGWMLGGVDKAAEEAAEERSSEIDVQILEWTIGALGDDDSLKSFFETIPGFYNSQLVKFNEDLSDELIAKFTSTLGGFLGRTWTSNSIDNSEKGRRLDIFINALNQIRKTHPFILDGILLQLRDDEVPQTIEMGHTLVHWCAKQRQTLPPDAMPFIAGTLVRVRERDDSWIALAAQVFGLSEQNLRAKIALGGDNVLLAILLHYTTKLLDRRAYPNQRVLKALSKLNIHNTHPILQRDFCSLWNMTARYDATSSPYFEGALYTLRGIRLLYIELHKGTDAAPTAFDASIDESSPILRDSSSYPLCSLYSHKIYPISVPLPTPHSPTPPHTDGDNLNPALQQATEQVDVIEPLSSNPMNSTTTSEIGTTSHVHDMAPPIIRVYPDSRPSDASPTVVVAPALQDIASTATLSHSLEDPDIMAPSAEPGAPQILSISPAPITASPLNTSSKSYDAGVVSVSNPPHFALPSIGSPIPAPHSTASATLPRLRVRGLVNTGNMCFANAVLQLLVNSPPFYNIFRELDDLKAQRGAGVPATPLLDTTMRFFKEFMVEEPLSTQRQSKPAATSRAEETKQDNAADSFEPTYLYDAMKEKRELNPLLDGQQQDAEQFLSLYLDALDEESPALLASISGPGSVSAALEIEKCDVSQSDQTKQGSQSVVTNLIKSPITHIFGGKFRSPDPIPTEDWRLLHLNIQPDSVLTVEDALMRVSQSQSMPDGPSGSGDANQQTQMLIEALPPVLVLHLKRFRYDATEDGITKIGKSIQFGRDLQIPPDIMVPNAQRPSTAPPQYKLHGVLYHHGESAGSRHYTVDVLHPNEDGDPGEVWLHIDDETVSPMRHEDVFGERGTERAADDRCAYLLFYCRTSPIGTS